MSGMYPTNEETLEMAIDIARRFDTSPGGQRFFDGERAPAWMYVAHYLCSDVEDFETKVRDVIESLKMDVTTRMHSPEKVE